MNFGFLNLNNPYDRREFALRNAYLKANSTSEKIEIRNKILKLVDKIVYKQAIRFAKKSSISFDDYYQEAMTNIIDAIDNEFDFSSNNKIITFLFYKIYYSMQNLKASMDGSYKAGPTNIKIAYKLKGYLEKHPNITIDELANIFKIKKQRIPALLSIDKKCLSTSKEIDERHTIEDILPDNNDNPLNAMLKENFVDELAKKLTEKELYVVISMFGFNKQGVPKKLREVAEVLNCTSERVRQIKNEAVKKIRQDKMLTEYLTELVNN